jgi:polyisoprenoid-binding protein YceI
MKRTLLNTLFVAALTFGYAAHARAADTYTFDPNHTAVTWHADHFGFSHPVGKFPGITGTLTLDEAHPENSKVQITVAINNADSSIPKLDEHMKSPAFFDAAKFPTATFVSDKVEVTGKDTAKVTGTLTIKGIAKPLVLDVKLNKLAPHPMSNKKTAGISATATVKRSDYGMTFALPGLGDDVPLDIEAEASVQ